jgi:hypothetical protein
MSTIRTLIARPLAAAFSRAIIARRRLLARHHRQTAPQSDIDRRFAASFALTRAL